MNNFRALLAWDLLVFMFHSCEVRNAERTNKMREQRGATVDPLSSTVDGWMLCYSTIGKAGRLRNMYSILWALCNGSIVLSLFYMTIVWRRTSWVAHCLCENIYMGLGSRNLGSQTLKSLGLLDWFNNIVSRFRIS